MISRLLDVAVLGALMFVLLRGNRLAESVRHLRKSSRIMKSEMQAAADDVDLPEPKVIKGQVVDRAEGGQQ